MSAGGIYWRIALLLGLVLCAPSSTSTGASAADDSQLPAIIERSRAALGPGLGIVSSLHISGAIEEAGVSGTWDRWEDLRNSRFADVTNAGPFTGAYGYDGKTAWMQDAKGIVLPQDGPSAIALNATRRYALTYRLWSPDHGGAVVSLLGARKALGTACQAISVKPPGGYSEELCFDEKTGILARTIHFYRGREATTTYSDHRLVDGLMFPWKMEISDGTSSRVLEVRTAEANPPDLEQHLQQPLTHPHDFSLTGGETNIPLTNINDHVLMDVRINGKGPYSFWFDTGAHNMMDPTVAHDAGVTMLGEMRTAFGFGSRAREVGFAKVNQVAIGGAKLNDQYFEILQFGGRQSYRPFSYTPKKEVQGIIGYELPARFTTTIDYARSSLKLQDSNADHSASDGALPLKFDSTVALIPCDIGAVPSSCILDTGSPLVVLTTTFVQSHPEIASRWSSGYGIIGFAGLSRGNVGKLSSLHLGSTAVNDVDAVFSTDDKGLVADTFLSPLVGQRVLKDFTVTLDYAHHWATLNRPSDVIGH